MWNKGTGWAGKQTFESVSTAPGVAFYRDIDNPTAPQDALWICYGWPGNYSGLFRRLLTSSG